jgi:hypothetical protein
MNYLKLIKQSFFLLPFSVSLYAADALIPIELRSREIVPYVRSGGGYGALVESHRSPSVLARRVPEEATVYSVGTPGGAAGGGAVLPSSASYVIQGGRNVLGSGSYHETKQTVTKIGSLKVDSMKGGTLISAKGPEDEETGHRDRETTSPSATEDSFASALSHMKPHLRPPAESMRALRELWRDKDQKTTLAVDLESLGRLGNVIALEMYANLLVNKAASSTEHGVRAPADSASSGLLTGARAYHSAGNEYQRAVEIYRQCLEYYEADSISYQLIKSKISHFQSDEVAARQRCRCYAALGVSALLVTAASVLAATWNQIQGNAYLIYHY